MTECPTFLFKLKHPPVCNCWRLLPFLLLLLLTIGLAGCAGKSKTEELLTTEYQTMSDDDLLLHYYQLEDQIVAEERTSSGVSFGLGLGMGSYGGGSMRSGGVGVSTGTDSPPVATDLRDRRNLVRLELKKRGLTP